MSAPSRGRERRGLGDVLVATDFSAGAEQAVARAARLPMRRGSSLTILHVLPAGLDRKAGARARAEARTALAATAALARSIIGGDAVRVVPRLGKGIPFLEIIRHARRDRTDLVVVGRHGHRTFRELLLGSTAERVVRKGDTSVLVVDSKPAGAYVRPLVAIDLSRASGAVVDLALRVADTGVRSIGVVHAYETAPESTLRRAFQAPRDIQRYQRTTRQRAHGAVAALLRDFVEAEVRPRIVVRRGDARRVILDVAAQSRPDLLALGTHGRTGVTYVLLGSVAAAVVRATPCDVLVARPRRRRARRP